MRNGEFFFFIYHCLLGSLFILSLKVLRVLIRVFDVWWLFFYFDIFEFLLVANIKIKKGHTTSEKTWLIHLTKNYDGPNGSLFLSTSQFRILKFALRISEFEIVKYM